MRYTLSKLTLALLLAAFLSYFAPTSTFASVSILNAQRRVTAYLPYAGSFPDQRVSYAPTGDFNEAVLRTSPSDWIDRYTARAGQTSTITLGGGDLFASASVYCWASVDKTDPRSVGGTQTCYADCVVFITFRVDRISHMRMTGDRNLFYMTSTLDPNGNSIDRFDRTLDVNVLYPDRTYTANISPIAGIGTEGSAPVPQDAVTVRGAEGQLSLSIIAAPFLARPYTVNGLRGIAGRGGPGWSYKIERSISAAGPWLLVGGASSGTTGDFSFLDTNPPTGGTVFYRARE